MQLERVALPADKVLLVLWVPQEDWAELEQLEVQADLALQDQLDNKVELVLQE